MKREAELASRSAAGLPQTLYFMNAEYWTWFWMSIGLVVLIVGIVTITLMPLKKSDAAGMKKYAVCIDTSPTEQLVADDDQIFAVGVLFGLKSTKSFDQVGSDFPDEEKKLKLRKFAGSSRHYRTAVKDHLRSIKGAPHVLASVSVVNQRFIKRMGLPVWEKAHGELPAPFDQNKKGKPRYRLGGYKKDDGIVIPPYTVLEDDLVIIGWLASELGLLHAAICEINQDLVKLDVLMDRLPNDQGPEGINKAELLKWTIGKLSEGTINIVGIPDAPDHYQRDLLTDNIAGIVRELMEADAVAGAQEVKDLLSLTRFNLPKYNKALQGDAASPRT